MCFVKRLTTCDLDRFCQELIKHVPKSSLEDWNIKFDEFPDHFKVTLSIKNVTSYTMVMDLYDIRIKIWNPGLLKESLIKELYKTFMFSIFDGDSDYKEMIEKKLRESCMVSTPLKKEK